MTNQATLYSTFLFATPSWIEGMARLADVAGKLNQYNDSSSGTAADIRALRADWEALGEDIRAAMRQVDPNLLERHEHDAYARFKELERLFERLIEVYEADAALSE